MIRFIIAVALAMLAVWLVIGVLWFALQVVPMFAVILIVIAFGALTALWENKHFEAQYRKDMENKHFEAQYRKDMGQE